MRFLILTAALGAIALPAVSADAQRWRGGYEDRDVRQELRECRRELRRADSRREYRRELRECRREIARARYDDRYDRYDRYPRGSYYQPHNRGRYWDGYRWRNRW